MSTERDGGPAFPMVREDMGGEPGMTLRDYFAGRAVTLFHLTEQNVDAILDGKPADHGAVARFCYGLADAMLAERAK